MPSEFRTSISDDLLKKIDSFCLSIGKSKSEFLADAVLNYFSIQNVMETYEIDLDGIISCVETYEDIQLSSEEILAELKKISSQYDQSLIKQLLLEMKKNSNQYNNQPSGIKLEISDEFFEKIISYYDNSVRKFFNISRENISIIDKKIENQKLAIVQIEEKMKPVIIEKNLNFFKLIFSLTSLKILATWIIIITVSGYAIWFNVNSSIQEITNQHFQRFQSTYDRNERWLYFQVINDIDDDFNKKVDAEIQIWIKSGMNSKERQELYKKSVLLMRKEVKKQ